MELLEPIVVSALGPPRRNVLHRCIAVAGLRAVNEILFARMERGADPEKEEVVDALFDARFPRTFAFFQGGLAADGSNEHERRAIQERRNGLLLEQFVRTESVPVRHAILPLLSLKPEDYSERVRKLLPRALSIAESHPDKLIRGRYAMMLMESRDVTSVTEDAYFTQLLGGDFHELVANLDHEQLKWNVPNALAFLGFCPKELFRPMIRAAVYEPDASFNQEFIKPCVAFFGMRAVAEALCEYAECGTRREIDGVWLAGYWIIPVVMRQGAYITPTKTQEVRDEWREARDRLEMSWLHRIVCCPERAAGSIGFWKRPLNPEERPADRRSLVADVVELRRRERLRRLESFVEGGGGQHHRPGMGFSLDPADYPDGHERLLEAARKIINARGGDNT
ncbi:hypothetical protein KJ567_00095 [Candidatus Bipolaricaulota bacterium]|nr:hypothetical protein [Candidatus Bipolaricaulota bacterium]